MAECSECGSGLKAGAKFCGECGASQESQTAGQAAVCVKCGSSMPEGVKFCGECGASQESQTAGQEAVCAKCGASMPEAVKFCGECGASRDSQATGPVGQDSAGPPAADVSAAEPAGRKRRQRTIVMIAAVVALLLVAGAVGIALKQSADRKAAESAKAAARKAQLVSARDSAAKVLATVEKCQSAVTVGTSLTNLSKLAAAARQDVTTFEASQDADLLPGFTTAISKAAQAYLDSSRAWFTDNERAQKKYDRAWNRYINAVGGSAPDIADYQDDSEYQRLWLQADGYIEKAKTAFESETAGVGGP